jgi:hypothetical protein
MRQRRSRVTRKPGVTPQSRIRRQRYASRGEPHGAGPGEEKRVLEADERSYKFPADPESSPMESCDPEEGTRSTQHRGRNRLISSKT